MTCSMYVITGDTCAEVLCGLPFDARSSRTAGSASLCTRARITACMNFSYSSVPS